MTKEPTLAELMVAAGAARDKLEASTEALNNAIFRAEEAFNLLQVGVTAEVPLAIGVVELAALRLGFGRFTDDWHLYIREENDHRQELLNASRRVRMIAAAALPRLLAAIEAEARVQVQAVDSARLDVLDFLGKLQEGGQGG